MRLLQQAQPEVFRIAPTRTMLAHMPAQWMLEVGDYNQDGRIFVVLVAEDKMYDAEYIEETEAELDLVGIGHETLTLDLPSTDFSPIIARIVTMDQLPDAVLIYVMGEPALMLQVADPICRYRPAEGFTACEQQFRLA